MRAAAGPAGGLAACAATQRCWMLALEVSVSGRSVRLALVQSEARDEDWAALPHAKNVLLEDSGQPARWGSSRT